MRLREVREICVSNNIFQTQIHISAHYSHYAYTILYAFSVHLNIFVRNALEEKIKSMLTCM